MLFLFIRFGNNLKVKKQVKNQALKKDRRTEGLELDEADMSQTQFQKQFEQFQQVDEDDSEEEIRERFESLQITEYQVLYQKGAEFNYLTILQTDGQGEGLDQGKNSPMIYAYCDKEDKSETAEPIFVQNEYGEGVYQNFLSQGWKDVTQSEDAYPWALKSWLAQHMKQDTI